MGRFFTVAIVLFALAFSGCATPQNDGFPIETRALDVFLIDKSNGQTMEVGRTLDAGGPGHRKVATRECKGLAEDAAKQKRLYDWDYYCCTVTDTSECASKVKELY